MVDKVSLFSEDCKRWLVSKPCDEQLAQPYLGCMVEQVSLFSENSSRWLVVDQAIMMNGAADAVHLLFL